MSSDQNAPATDPDAVDEATQVQDLPSRNEDGPAGAHAAGDALGGDEMPTGNDGTLGGAPPAVSPT